MDKMLVRNRAVLKTLFGTQQKVLETILTQKEFYKKLLCKLIVQGLVQLMEEVVKIRCLKRDAELVESVLREAEKEFKRECKDQLKEDVKIRLRIDEDHFLIERKLDPTIHDLPFLPSKEKEMKSDLIMQDKIFLGKDKDDTVCMGGVLLVTDDNSTLCKNTMDVRIEQAFSELLPSVRKLLFKK